MSFIEAPPFGEEPERPTAEDLQEDFNDREVDETEGTGDDLEDLRVRTEREKDLRNRDMLGLLDDDEKAELKRMALPPWLSDAKSLAECTEADLTPPCYRIEEMAVCDGNTNIFALYKTGKTVLIGNVAQSLADNTPFLGRYAIEPVKGNIGILNYEMIKAQFNHWLDQQGIENKKRVFPLHLRGMGAYLEDDETLGYLLQWLVKFNIEVLIIDTLTSALHPDSNPNLATVAATFTARVDNLKLKSPLRDVFLASHTGHPKTTGRGGTPLDRHTAGSQKFMAWGEANWDYSSDAKGIRHLSTSGRIENWLPSTQVAFDPDTKQLTLGWTKGVGSKRPNEQVKKDIKRLLKQEQRTGDGWVSKNGIETGVPGGREQIREALAELVTEEKVVVKDGARGSILHRWNR